MKITRIREATAPIASEIRNAFISFSTMTVSLVAVETDVVREGEPVIGYGFTSNGRYAQGGILRERFIPRIMAAEPKSLIDEANDNLDPFAVWKAFMANEKPGGHGDRAHAAGALDMAMWDAVAKIAGKSAVAAAVRALQRRAVRREGARLSGRRLLLPGQGARGPARPRCAATRSQGYKVVKMKIGGADLATDLKRIEAVIEVAGTGANVAVDANGRFDLATALAYGKAIEPYGLFWYEEPGDPLDFQLNAVLAEHYAGALATGENLFSAIDGRNLLRYGGLRPDRDWVQLDPALAYGLTEYLRFLDVVRGDGLVAAAAHPARRASAGAQHRGRPADRRLGELSRRVPALRRLCRQRSRSSTATSACTRTPGIGMELQAQDVRRDAQAIGARRDHPPLDGEGGEARTSAR